MPLRLLAAAVFVVSIGSGSVESSQAGSVLSAPQTRRGESGSLSALLLVCAWCCRAVLPRVVSPDVRSCRGMQESACYHWLACHVRGPPVIPEG